MTRMGNPDVESNHAKPLRSCALRGGCAGKFSEVHVHTNCFDQRRTAVFVVPRMGNVLQVERVKDTSPRMQVVVALEDIFSRVVQPAVAEKKSKTAKLQVVLMIFFDRVRDKRNSELVVGPRPRPAGIVSAELDRLIDFGVGE